ncbi:hypothetical protein Tsp_04626 [Trichinella spiralis]|uniref:hypothetical protein n=1 Tax=Trichinella spiralis TaxID=6334 RepID=UPI0001EFD594|nr:hypothetical protein Tsp_04626 [Trichinella spiralis]
MTFVDVDRRSLITNRRTNANMRCSVKSEFEAALTAILLGAVHRFHSAFKIKFLPLSSVLLFSYGIFFGQNLMHLMKFDCILREMYQRQAGFFIQTAKLLDMYKNTYMDVS